MRLRVTRILTTSLLAMMAIGVAAWFGGRWWLSWSLMPLDGEETLTGLEAPAEVLFDDRGIPQVYAETDADALRTLGWLHASERLFQMELLRRVARGEISALVGTVGIESDLTHRHYGFARRVEMESPSLSPPVSKLMQAYVDGINARIGSGRPLPPEFVLLGVEPTSWSIGDVIMLGYYQTWFPTTLNQRMAEAWRATVETHGTDASAWLRTLPSWGIPSIPDGLSAQSMTKASNTWVVSPDRSDSGAALHASDPHLEYTRAPGLWYAVGLHSSESLQGVGVTVPGLPFIAMGHNGRIAFAFTVAPVDLFEIYRFEPVSGASGRWQGPESGFSVRRTRETIKIRGRETPLERELLVSPFGPAKELDDGRLEVLHWAGFDLPLTSLIENGLALNRAGDFDAFRAAAGNMGALSVNWSYSDRNGNIGTVQSTPIPLRTHEAFHATLDGADPDNHWAGFVSPEARPHALNPEQGWLANANNHAAVDAPWPMPGFYLHLRMRRAVDWLQSRDRFSAEDMTRMQLDQTSERALQWKDWLAEIADATGRRALATALRDWDGVMRRESTVAGRFALWWHLLPGHLFAETPLAAGGLGQAALDDWMNRPPEHFDLASIPLETAARRALTDALRFETHTLGGVQTLTIEHALSRSSLLNAWLDLTRGPIPVGGSEGSLNATFVRWDAQGERLRAGAGASMRFVMDWANPDAFTLNLTLGQSGHPSSPHFSDQLADFLTGMPRVLPFTREAVKRISVSRLTLQP